MATTRYKTKYPGVFYRLVQSRVRKGSEEKVFYIYFKKDGKPVEEKVGKSIEDKMTPAVASRILSERMAGKRKSRKELREEAASKVEPWTIGRLWDEYRKHLPGGEATKPDLSRWALYLEKPFAKKEPKELCKLDTDRLRINLLKTRKPQTVKHVLALLRRIINFGVDRGLCPTLPFSISLPPVDNLKTEDLSTDQLKSLLQAIEQDPCRQAGALMKFVLFTGMRRGELFKLQWTDIDFDRGFIQIRAPKGGRDEKIPLNDGARQILKEQPRTSLFVFPGRGGNQRTAINHQIRRIADAAGLPPDFRPLHGLRHFFASSLASSGQVDLYTLQRLLTHKSPQMTQRYAHLRDEVLRAGSDVISGLMSNADNAGTNAEKVVSINSRGQKK